VAVSAAAAMTLPAQAWAQAGLSAQATPTPAALKKPRRAPLDLNKSLGITELKLEMAENRFKFFPTLPNALDVVVALEGFLNGSCFSGLQKTLGYQGPPEPPQCIRAIQRLLELNPNNPVAVCARDGITNPSCVQGYQDQQVEVYHSGSSDDAGIDPIIKAGLGARELTRIEQYSLTLRDVDGKYQNTEDLEEKKLLMEDAERLYTEATAAACRIFTVRFIERRDRAKPQEDPAIREALEKLAKIPPKLREEHREKMIGDAEERLAKAKNSSSEQERIQQLLKALKEPAQRIFVTAETHNRVRLITRQCDELTKLYLKTFPSAAPPVCHREGWYTPRCILALRAARDAKELGKKALKGTPNATSGNRDRDEVYTKF
jgi:hypothetical protein